MKSNAEMREVMEAADSGKCRIDVRSREIGAEWILIKGFKPSWNWAECDYRINLPTEPGSPLNYWEAREAIRRRIPITDTDGYPATTVHHGNWSPDGLSKVVRYRLPPAKPQPVPPGDLTLEEAQALVDQGIKLQYWSPSRKRWEDRVIDTAKCHKDDAYRRKPAPTVLTGYVVKSHQPDPYNHPVESMDGGKTWTRVKEES